MMMKDRQQYAGASSSTGSMDSDDPIDTERIFMTSPILPGSYMHFNKAHKNHHLHCHQDRLSPRSVSSNNSEKNLGSPHRSGSRRKPCNVEGCTTFAVKEGLCKAHGGFLRCWVEGCNKHAVREGMCKRHHSTIERKCTTPGCKRFAKKMNLCLGHYAQTNKKDDAGRPRVVPMMKHQHHHLFSMAASPRRGVVM